MAATSVIKASGVPAPLKDPSGTGRKRVVYTSQDLAVEASGAASVWVNLSIGSDNKAFAQIEQILASRAPVRKGAATKLVVGQWRSLLEEIATSVVQDALSGELEKMVREYGLMLRESLAKGDDRTLKAALNRARLQERILAATPMVDQAQACELLGLSSANPSATMKRKEERKELLRFTVDGRAAYPLFQFDVENRRTYPAIARLIALKPEGWSDFRLLHWLIRPHLDFSETPAQALGGDEGAVIAAFRRVIEPALHG